jgi:hypothetical protein
MHGVMVGRGTSMVGAFVVCSRARNIGRIGRRMTGLMTGMVIMMAVVEEGMGAGLTSAFVYESWHEKFNFVFAFSVVYGGDG